MGMATRGAVHKAGGISFRLISVFFIHFFWVSTLSWGSTESNYKNGHKTGEHKPQGSKTSQSKFSNQSIFSMDACAGYYAQEKYEKALECFSALIRREGESSVPILLYAAGYSAYQIGRYDTAFRLFSRLAEKTPQKGDVFFMIGMTEFRRKRYKKARIYINRGLKMGLKDEDPEEARETLKLIERFLASARRRRLQYRASVSFGYDSRPRVSGAAFDGRTNTWSSTESSFFFDISALLGYRWEEGHFEDMHVFTGGVYYGFAELLFLSDFQETELVRRMSRDSEPAPLSLQVHRVFSSLGYRYKNFGLALSVEGFFELRGVTPIEPFTLGAKVALEGIWGWSPKMQSRLKIQAVPQRALLESYGYLSGTSLSLMGSHRYKPVSWLRLDVGYQYSRWWLGDFAIDRRDCFTDDSCLLRSSYSSNIHGGDLGFAVQPFAWWQIEAKAGFRHVRFVHPAVFLVNSREVEKRRSDIWHRYGMWSDFRFAKSWWIGVGYFLECNHSNITPESTKMDENYVRHIIETRIRYNGSGGTGLSD